MENKTKEAVSGGISRRRLLKLAAYSVPAASLVNVAAASRALAQTTPPPGRCVACNGGGLWMDLYDNPWWRGSPVDGSGWDTPCHGAPWYPIQGDTTFSARWVGSLCIASEGTYHLRVRGQDWVKGYIFVNDDYVTIDGTGTTSVYLICNDYPVDILYRHTTNNAADAWVKFEWSRDGGTTWTCVPTDNLKWA